jgi:hypothetical protein
MEDELILSEENQVKLSSIIKKMQDNKESQQNIDYITSEFKRERGEKMTAETQESKKKSTGDFQSLLEESPLASTFKNYYETPREDVPNIFGNVGTPVKSPLTGYGSTPFKGDEKYSYPFAHGKKEEPKKEEISFLEKPLPYLIDKAKSFAADNTIGDLEDGEFQGPKPSDFITDESPNELQRLINRAVARGIRADIFASQQKGARIEDLAYLNYIEQRDAPRYEDYLVADPATLAGSPSFVLDALRSAGESIISQVAAAPVGAVGAGVGAAAGAGAGLLGGPFAALTVPAGATYGALGGFATTTSAAIEYGGKVNEVLMEAGVDVTDAEALTKAFADEKLMDKAREMGLRRGIPVGAFDGVASIVGGQLIGKAIPLGSRAVRKAVVKEAGVQAALGAGGETAGQVVADEEIRPRDIALEAFAEVLSPSVGTVYNIAKENAISQPERDYLDFAEKQDQKKLAGIRNLTFAVNNAEIAAVDDQITDLRRSKISEDRPERKAIDIKIKQLVERKYTRMREIQEDLLETLSDEEINTANTLVDEIITAQASLKKSTDLSPAERSAVEDQFKTSAQALQDIYAKASEARAQKPAAPEAGEQVVSEKSTLGRISQSASKEVILQSPDLTPEQRQLIEQSEDPLSLLDENQKASLDSIIEKRTAEFKKKGFLNLFEPVDRIAYAKEMESQTPAYRREMEKVMLAFDAFRQVSPEGKYFNVGFGAKGYSNAGRNAGIDTKGSLGVTQTGDFAGGRRAGDRIIVQFSTGKEDIRGVGYKGTSNPFKTAAHEVFHNVFASHFEKNETDFNQFRELVIRRLSESDVRRLNEFADRYDERDTPGYGGAYKSEEFMVDLGALLSDEQVTFQKNFLEELKAFLNRLVGKLTGQTVQIFEDAALSRDIASYMTGVSQTIRTGGNLSDVKMPERLKTDRFKRSGGPVFVQDVLDDKPFVNLAGREDPTSYERKLRTDEVLFEMISNFTDDVLKRAEKKLGIGALRGVPKALLQAMEVAGSMNIETENRFFLAMVRVRKTLNKASAEERARITELSKDALFSEETDTRAAAFGELMNGSPIEQAIASDISILIAIREKQQDTLINGTAFDNLSEELRETIKSRNQFYGTRTYRIFTDPNFKPNNDLKEQAISDLVQLEIDERAEALFFENAEITDADGNAIEDPDEVDYMNYVQRKDGLKIANSVRAKVNNIVGIQGQKKSGGDSTLGGLRVPSKQLGKRGDLPESLRNFMGEEKNPFVKLSQTFTNLNSLIQQYTLVDQVNQAARNSGLSALIVSQPIVSALKKNNLKGVNLLSLARQMNIIPVDQEFKGKSDALRNMILDKLQLEYTQVNESKSPMNGKYVSNDFLELFKQTPLYSSENPVLQAYFAVLLQLRRIRVLYNLPTWRKNIMGGYYFLMLNGVFPYNKARGGFTFLKDTKNRFRKLRTGQLDPETQATFEEMGQNGLLGASVNAGLFSEINNSFINSLNGENPSDSWSWLAKLNNRRKQTASRLGYQYGAIDDYTKFVAYTSKRENFAKRLASNPEGKPYAQLNPEEQKEVQKMTAERIKQNFPTMSRIHPAFRQLMKTPLGDFLSFRLEAFRSYFSVFNNAISDINEGINNSNLSTSQRNAYLSEGITAMVTMISLASIQNIGYIAAAKSFFDDDEEKELAEQMRGVPFLLPNWMQGSNIVPASMKADGTIRYINVSSEDPYDEVGGLIFGRNGVARSETLMAIAKDFTQPNMLVSLATNLQKGQDSYGRPISDPNDNAFAKAINIAGYLASETYIPPNIKFIAKKLKEEAKASEDPDYELKPLELAFQLSTNTVFRDYPVNIGTQFYYNLRDGNFGGKQIYAELSDSQKIVLRSRLERVREGYTTLTQYGEVFENPELQENAYKNIMRTFRDDEDALYYLLAGAGPIAEALSEDGEKSK